LVFEHVTVGLFVIHLIKLAVGVRDLPHLEANQRARAEASGDLSARRAYTRNKPVRPDAEDGSLFWVIQGVIRCRQKLIGFEKETDGEGRPYCLFVLDPALIPVVPTARGPFQGWRYLQPDAAPGDIAPGADGEMPPDDMLAELRSLGLI
jgi:hypothetical protein